MASSAKWKRGEISIELSAVLLISFVVAVSLLFYSWYSHSLTKPLAQEKERHKHEVQCYREVIKVKEFKYLGLLGPHSILQNLFNDSNSQEDEKFYAPPKTQVVYIRLPKDITVQSATMNVQGGLN